MQPMKHSAHIAKHASTAGRWYQAATLALTENHGKKTRRTVAISICAVLRCIQNHLEQFEEGNNQGAERNRAEGEGRRADESGERGVFGLTDAVLILASLHLLGAQLTCLPSTLHREGRSNTNL